LKRSSRGPASRCRPEELQLTLDRRAPGRAERFAGARLKTLFVALRMVVAHLSRTYDKLGIRLRNDLRAALTAGQGVACVATQLSRPGYGGHRVGRVPGLDEQFSASPNLTTFDSARPVDRRKRLFAGASHAGGGTRTPDTRIMIPLL
jgi:hypothetical protein